ncbi:sensor histidine kinase [Nonomuraea sp. NPDC050536]|uniref:sensor histidine kinase n=1 Tax=Nonomuraea sp. NPDC050536 TaxID=3364366 RepID=UPI0037C52BEE
MKSAAPWAALAFALGLLLIWGGASVPRGISGSLLVPPLALTCAGVVVRRSHPIASLALGTVGIGLDIAVGPSLATVLVFTDNLYAAALYGPARLSRWLLGLTSVLAVLAGAVTAFVAHDLRMVAVIGIQAGLVLVTPVTTALVLRQQRDQAETERARAEQVAHLAELDRQAAISAERTRMARELHDMIANHFSAIAIQSTAALSREDLDPATIRKIMESVRANSVKGMAEMRSMIGLLRQEGDEPDATRLRLADSEGLVERSRQAGMDVELRVDGAPRELPAPVDLAGYRILQEALTNALKHGDSPAKVHIAYKPEHVTLTVDNVVSDGQARLPGSEAGLVGMEERATLVGGTFEAGLSTPGPRGHAGRQQKWRVEVTLPAPVEEDVA